MPYLGGIETKGKQMTRKEIEAEYTIEDGVIQNLGKFENEPAYVVYFWNAYLDGCADDDDGDVLTFDIGDDDIKEFPELAGYKQVFLWETDSGFVGHDLSR